MIRRRLLAPWFLVCLLGIAGTLPALPAAAQQAHYYTYVSYWAVPRADWAQMESFMKQTNPTMEKLVASGTVTAWGSDRNLVHDPDGWTHADWMTAPSRAGILEAIDALRGVFASAPVLAGAKHWDIFLRTRSHGGKTARLDHGYGLIFTARVKPGRGDEWEAFEDKYLKAMLDRMLANGTILMYNFDTPEFSTGAAPSNLYVLAVFLPDAKAVDTFSNEFNAYWQQNPAVPQAFSGLAVADGGGGALAELIDYQHK